MIPQKKVFGQTFIGLLMPADAYTCTEVRMSPTYGAMIFDTFSLQGQRFQELTNNKLITKFKKMCQTRKNIYENYFALLEIIFELIIFPHLLHFVLSITRNFILFCQLPETSFCSVNYQKKLLCIFIRLCNSYS